MLVLLPHLRGTKTAILSQGGRLSILEILVARVDGFQASVIVFSGSKTKAQAKGSLMPHRPSNQPNRNALYELPRGNEERRLATRIVKALDPAFGRTGAKNGPNQWEYVGTTRRPRTGRHFHLFRHRNHPTTGKEQRFEVPSSLGFTPCPRAAVA